MDAKILAQTVETVFLTMLDLEVWPGEKPWTSSGQLMSAVHLSGTWNGALLFECDQQPACQFAGRLLSMDPPAVVTDEVRDVLGELANMIGGNMKSTVATGLILSLPSVFEGTESVARICEGDVQDRLEFDSPEGPFRVTLLVEKNREKGPSACQERAFSD